jgi:hypothetical protein
MFLQALYNHNLGSVESSTTVKKRQALASPPSFWQGVRRERRHSKQKNLNEKQAVKVH